MPKISLLPGGKGLVQETGKSVAGETIAQSATQTIGASGTILTNGRLIARVDAGGGARTGVIMEAGTEDGQICIVMNTGGETLTMAAAGTSNVTTGTGCVIGVGAVALFVFDTTIGDWHPLVDTDS